MRAYKRFSLFEQGTFPVRVGHLIERNPKSSLGWAPEYHAEFEIQLFRRGTGNYFVHDTNYTLGLNSILYIRPNEIHNYIPDTRSTTIKKLTLVFAPKLIANQTAARAALLQIESVRHLILPERVATTAELLLSSIDDECTNHERYWQEMTLGLLQTFLITLSRVAGGGAVRQENTDPVIQKILSHLDARFAERLTLADVSSNFNMSLYTLSKRFKRYVGLGFQEYLTHRRIAEAQRCLEETDLKIVVVSHQSGFESLSAFNRDFRMLTGLTPSEYRQMVHAKRRSDAVRKYPEA